MMSHSDVESAMETETPELQSTDLSAGSAPSSAPAAPLAPPLVTLAVGADGIAILTLDVPGESQNTLKAALMDEFEPMLLRIEGDAQIRAVVFCSGKPDTFLAGADLNLLREVKTAQDGQRLSTRASSMLGKLAASKKPVVAAIHGTCLGGGLELALACHARVCSDDRKTELGLPEVQLGLLPGAGGTQRLPRLIGIAQALDLMLTGKKVKGAKALKLGLVDEVVPRANLLKAARAKAEALCEQLKTEPKGAGALSKLQLAFRELTNPEELQTHMLEDNPLGRKVLFQQARKQLRAKTQGNYPAPERILEAVEAGMARGMEEGLRTEARLFGELMVSPQARQLMGIYFATQAMKKDSGVDDPAVLPLKVSRVGMLGAGLMGAGIAYVTASQAALPVRLKDRDAPAVARGLKTFQDLVQARLKRRALTRAEADLQASRVTGTASYTGLERCEVVIEAVFEDLSLKHRMIQDIEAIAPPSTIFASNTSSIPITRLAEGATRPERVIGMHYFSPVEKMPLLEIIVTEKTAPEVVATCVELGKRQGKTVIVVKDGVGFYTTRILAPYLNEAARILAEGVAIETIDQALKQWGFPVGPITLMDEVGIDVGAKVGHIMIEAFGDRVAPPPVFQKLIDDGRAGRKNQRGFYRYEGGKKKGADPSIYKLLDISPSTHLDALEIAERCVLQLVNEALLCWGEGILRSPRDGDIGAIFGLGFPPFRGGPFRYVDTLGASIILKKLQALELKHGHRFRPAPALVELAAAAKTFYP